MPIKLNGETGGSVSWDAPDNTSPSGTDVTLTLPTSAGSAGQYLRNSSTAGTLEFGDLPSSSSSFAVLAEQQSANTDGGTFTAGAWRTRDINTELFDPDSIVSLNASTNEFTLQAGTYVIEFLALGYSCSQHVARIYDVTGTAELAYSLSVYAASSVQNAAEGIHRFTISSSNSYRLEHRCVSSKSTNGLGVAANLAPNETYCLVKITKEA